MGVLVPYVRCMDEVVSLWVVHVREDVRRPRIAPAKSPEKRPLGILRRLPRYAPQGKVR